MYTPGSRGNQSPPASSNLCEPAAPRAGLPVPVGAQQTSPDGDKHLLYLNTRRTSQSANESQNRLGACVHTATVGIVGNYIPAISVIIILMTKGYTLRKGKL